MEQDPDQPNIKTVSYRKILPKYEVWPATDAIDYIDLQYDSTVYKVSPSEDESPSKFNSLPTIKSGRKARYISALEAIALPRGQAKADLSIIVPETASPASPGADNQSKLSDTTTVVIHESPRGICNDAFEDDEDTVDCKKHLGASSPSHSSVSFSSNDSTVHIPEEVNIDAAIQKKLESEGYSKQQIEGQLKKKWRSEKLYFNQDQHSRTFCWWMLSLILLAGAITVAALIGVGVIKLPIKETSLQSDTMIKMDDTRPRLSFVGLEDGSDDRLRSFIDATTSSEAAPTPTTTEVYYAFTRKEDNELVTEIPSSSAASEEPFTPETRFNEAATMMKASTEPITSTTAKPIIVEDEGSGDELEAIEMGSGSEDVAEDNNDDTLGPDNFFLDEINTPQSLDAIENVENNEFSENLEISDDGSGEVELIITLPDIEGSGSSLNAESFTSGEEVFKALIDFLIPSKDREILTEDENVAFKDLFNFIAS